MKSFFPTILTFIILVIAFACQPAEQPTPAPKKPAANAPDSIEVNKKGTFTSQNGSKTKGTVELVTGENGDVFLRLGSDFNSSFHTGTVTVYLSTSKNLKLSESSSFQKVAVVDEGGEHFLELPSYPDAKFSHGILWCGAAGIPFGYAELQ